MCDTFLLFLYIYSFLFFCSVFSIDFISVIKFFFFLIHRVSVLLSFVGFLYSNPARLELAICPYPVWLFVSGFPFPLCQTIFASTNILSIINTNDYHRGRLHYRYQWVGICYGICLCVDTVLSFSTSFCFHVFFFVSVANTRALCVDR